jgi:hypothetical protein
MEGVGDALKTIFDKIGGFFDIFDLSFLVSGAVSVSALLFAGYLTGKQLSALLEGWWQITALILACYVNGLICFALGRALRMWIMPGKREGKFNGFFIGLLHTHGLVSKKPICEYITLNDQHNPVEKVKHAAWRLYVRLWAEVRHAEPFKPSLAFLNRYWVMAATYDGLAISLLIWLVVIVLSDTLLAVTWSLWIKISLPLLFLILVAVCWREANRYFEYQVEELVAVIAAKEQNGEERPKQLPLIL